MLCPRKEKDLSSIQVALRRRDSWHPIHNLESHICILDLGGQGLQDLEHWF